MPTSTDQRTKKTQLNIFFSFLIKIFGIGTSLLLIRLTLNYLNESEYGIWLALNSVLLWINSFDIGLGNGLRNKLSEALAKNDYVNAKKYITTAYFIIILLMLGIFFIFTLANHFIDWYQILNINPNSVKDIGSVVIMAFGCFCVTFVLKLIGSILLAQQKAAVENLLIMLGQVLSLIIIVILIKTVKGDLFYVAFAYSISPAIIYAVSYPFVFSGNNRKLIPNIKYIDKSYIKPLLGLGGQFFVLQISGLIIFSTSSILIANLFGPELVTKYNIAFRYFNVVPLVFSIVLIPIWSATTEAYVKNDIEWIKKSKRKINLLLLATFIGLVVMVVISDYVYEIWIGKDIEIPFMLSAALGVYIFLIISSLCYSSFLNGIGKLRVQMMNTIFSAVIFIPLNYLLCDYFGVLGIVLSLIAVNLSGLVINIIQFNLIINSRAKGIWNK